MNDVSDHGRERSTRQKRALAAVLDGSVGFRSAQDLFAELRANGERVGLTTVYNQLRTLADAGEIDILRADEGETLYRRCSSESHHHHLSCRSCGMTVEIAADEVEAWAERTAAEHNFRDVQHTLEIVGICGECARRR